MRSYLVSKRIFDFTLAAAALIAFAPLMAVIALAVRWGSAGPALYRGPRVGRGGRLFHMLKFRTMVVDAEKLGGSATANDDRRITRVGALLRRYKLDELPQLINVLKGEMSFVGPRPEVRKYCDALRGEQRAILAVTPGITDWATIWNADEGTALAGAQDPERAYEELIRPTKLALQLYYVRTRSFATDVRILLHTFCRLLNSEWLPGEIAGYGRLKPYSTLSRARVANG